MIILNLLLAKILSESYGAENVILKQTTNNTKIEVGFILDLECLKKKMYDCDIINKQELDFIYNDIKSLVEPIMQIVASKLKDFEGCIYDEITTSRMIQMQIDTINEYTNGIDLISYILSNYKHNNIFVKTY